MRSAVQLYPFGELGAIIDVFAEAFLETLDEVAKVDLATRDAWEAVLWPGIEYLKRRCALRDPAS